MIDTDAPPTPSLDLDPAFDSPPIGDQATSEAEVTLIGLTEPESFVTLVETGQNVVADASGNFAFTNVSLAIGSNAFTVIAADLAGNQSQFTQTIDRIEVSMGNPVIAVELLNDTGSSSRDARTADPTLTGTVMHPLPVTVMFFLEDAGPGRDTDFNADITFLVNPDGSFLLDATFLETLIGEPTLPVGPYNYSLAATDAAGNTGLFYGEFFLAPPGGDSPPIATGIGLLNDTGPVSTDKFTTDPTLVGFVEGTDLVSVEFFYDSSDPGFSADITSMLDTNGDFTLDQVFLETLIGGPLPNQRHYFHLVAMDAAGNFAFKYDEFVYLESDDDDITAPIVSVDLLNDTGFSDSDNLTTDASLVGQVVDESPIELYVYFYEVNGIDEYEDYVTDLLQPDGSFIIPQSRLEEIAGGPLVPGDYEVYVCAEDRYSFTEELIAFTLLSAPGIPSITSVLTDTGTSNADGITNDTTLTIAGVAEPDVEIELSEATLGVLGTTMVDVAGDWSFELPGPGLIDGTYQFTAIAISPAGPRSDPSVSFSVTVDTDLPLRAVFDLDPSFDSGQVGDGYTTQGVVTLLGTTSPDAAVRLLNTGVTTTADADGNFSFNGVQLSLGRHVYRVETSDVAGNRLISSKSIIFDQPVELTETGFVTSATRLVELGQDSGTRTVTFRVDADFGATQPTLKTRCSYTSSLRMIQPTRCLIGDSRGQPFSH